MSQLVVVTYNVHGCVGTDRRRDVDRIVEVLRRTAADVIGLQEVDSHPFSGGAVRQLAAIAERLGANADIAPSDLRNALAMTPANDPAAFRSRVATLIRMNNLLREPRP